MLSFHGLDDLIHADTMLFILGLTFFVSVIAQTRMLEGITFFLLRRNGGAILPTVIAVTAVVAFASGILDGVSMIGLTIRTLVIILMLAAAPTAAVRYAVMVCTAVTTVCGVWLAYGEPPNLIMKANSTRTWATPSFCAIARPPPSPAISSIAWQLARTARGQRINLDNMDVIDANAEDVRFLQATRHGEVLTPVELVEGTRPISSDRRRAVIERLRTANRSARRWSTKTCPEIDAQAAARPFRQRGTGRPSIDHYVLDAAGEHEDALEAEQAVDDVLAAIGAASGGARRRSARLALVPFIAHARSSTASTTTCRCFWRRSPVSRVALLGIARIPKMRALALREAGTSTPSTTFCFRCSCRSRC